MSHWNSVSASTHPLRHDRHDQVDAGRRPVDGRQTASENEWRVPAQVVTDAAIIPPTDFVGEMNLSAELRGPDGAALVTTFFRLTWTSAQPGSAAVPAARTAAPPPAPPAPLRRRHSNRRPLHLRHRPHLPWPHHKRPRSRSGS